VLWRRRLILGMTTLWPLFITGKWVLQRIVIVVVVVGLVAFLKQNSQARIGNGRGHFGVYSLSSRWARKCKQIDCLEFIQKCQARVARGVLDSIQWGKYIYTYCGELSSKSLLAAVDVAVALYGRISGIFGIRSPLYCIDEGQQKLVLQGAVCATGTAHF
jgi:hypothetical protein